MRRLLLYAALVLAAALPAVGQPADPSRSPFAGLVPVAKAPAWITAAAFLPDGKALVATAQHADAGGPTALLDVPSLTVLREYPGFPDHAECLAVHPSARWLAAGGKMGWVGVWDLESARPLCFTEPRIKIVGLRVAFLPEDGRLLLEGGWYPATVFDWRASPPAPVRTLRQNVPRGRFALSPDGSKVAHEDESVLTVHDVVTGKFVWAQKQDMHPRALRAVAWSSDGARIAMVQGRELSVWDAAKGTRVGGFDIGAGHASTAAFSADLAWAVVAAGRLHEEGERLVVWRTATGERAHEIATECPRISDLALAPDGRHLLVHGPLGAVLLGAR
jgi:WD40 repeat protein